MNHDQQTLLSAYDETIKHLYSTLFDQYAQAAGDERQEEEAEQRFTIGIVLARRARDRAITLST